MVLATDLSHFPLSATVVVVTGFVAAATLGSLAWFRSNRIVGWKEEKQDPSSSDQPGASYDAGIEPAEVTARRKREGTGFKQTPNAEGDSRAKGGYTVDREGLLNNYAVEPEPYVNEPGDLKQQKSKQ